MHFLPFVWKNIYIKIFWIVHEINTIIEFRNVLLPFRSLFFPSGEKCREYSKFGAQGMEQGEKDKNGQDSCQH